jgi:ATP/maltotriose-dependent transcriptional regulator MalT
MPRKRNHKSDSHSQMRRRAVWLTRREIEVLGLMATGMNNRQMSMALSIAQGTVKIHVHNILAKLDVNSRTGAIAKAHANQLLPIR